MSNEITKSRIQSIKEVVTGKGALSVFRDMLPSAMSVNEDKARQIAKRYGLQIYAAVLQNTQLQECTVNSLIRESCKAASLDLDIDLRGLAYLVPFKNKGTMEAQLIIGYKGLMELAYRSGKVKVITAEVIRESEKGQITITRKDGQMHIEHPWGWTQPTGDIVAAYAVAEVEGYGPMTRILRKEEIETYRAKSKARDGFGWKDNYEAMCKKTAIRRLADFLPKSILKEFSEAVAQDEAQDFASASTAAQETINEQAGSEVVDAAFEAPTPESEEPDFMQEG
jgi:recombination protein RecT